MENTAETNAEDLNISNENVPYVGDESFETLPYDKAYEEEGTYVSQYGRRSKPKKSTDYDELKLRNIAW